MISDFRMSVARRPKGYFSRYIYGPLFGKPFNGKSSHRLLILYEPNRISYASVYPFLFYAKAFSARYDVQIRLLSTQKALAEGIPRGLHGASHVIVQSLLLDPQERQIALAQLLDSLPDETVKAYLDTFANNDIRLMPKFPRVNFYFKKSLFADLSKFTEPTYGDTNLTDYYGRLYNIPNEKKNWKVPISTLDKLRLSPNFLTDSSLSAAILEVPEVPSPEGRDIDLHARLGGTKKQDIYGEMRRRAERTVSVITDLNIAMGTGISRKRFLEEMRRSKICFSPFGYGEVCWRDIEAIASGAVLLKPDMSHLRTAPDLYRDDETYVACRWDFADVEDKIRALLTDDERRARIARTAHRIALDYLKAAGPVDTFAPLFEPTPADTSRYTRTGQH